LLTYGYDVSDFKNNLQKESDTDVDKKFGNNCIVFEE